MENSFMMQLSSQFLFGRHISKLAIHVASTVTNRVKLYSQSTLEKSFNTEIKMKKYCKIQLESGLASYLYL